MRARQTADTATLAKLIDALTPHEGTVELRMDGLRAVRVSQPNQEPVNYVQRSSLCLAAQGAKIAMIGGDTYAYQAGQMALYSVEVPMAGRVTRASYAELYLLLSVTSFHRQFKAVTGMSPLYYQKTLRLQEARRLMLTAMIDAGSAGRRVGYISPAQFSREYSRFFGSAPMKDINRLREEGRRAADATS